MATTRNPGISKQPAHRWLEVATPVSFIAQAYGNPPPTVQWQKSIDGGTTFTDIVGATTATPVNTTNWRRVVNSTYTFTPSSGDVGSQYRAVFTNTNGTATTQAGILKLPTGTDITAVINNPGDTAPVTIYGHTTYVTLELHNVATNVTRTTPALVWDPDGDGRAVFEFITPNETAMRKLGDTWCLISLKKMVAPNYTFHFDPISTAQLRGEKWAMGNYYSSDTIGSEPNLACHTIINNCAAAGCTAIAFQDGLVANWSIPAEGLRPEQLAGIKDVRDYCHSKGIKYCVTTPWPDAYSSLDLTSNGTSTAEGMPVNEQLFTIVQANGHRDLVPVENALTTLPITNTGFNLPINWWGTGAGTHNWIWYQHEPGPGYTSAPIAEVVNKQTVVGHNGVDVSCIHIKLPPGEAWQANHYYPKGYLLNIHVARSNGTVGHLLFRATTGGTSAATEPRWVAGSGSGTQCTITKVNGATICTPAVSPAWLTNALAKKPIRFGAAGSATPTDAVWYTVASNDATYCTIAPGYPDIGTPPAGTYSWMVDDELYTSQGRWMSGWEDTTFIDGGITWHYCGDDNHGSGLLATQLNIMPTSDYKYLHISFWYKLVNYIGTGPRITSIVYSRGSPSNNEGPYSRANLSWQKFPNYTNVTTTPVTTGSNQFPGEWQQEHLIFNTQDIDEVAIYITHGALATGSEVWIDDLKVEAAGLTHILRRGADATPILMTSTNRAITYVEGVDYTSPSDPLLKYEWDKTGSVLSSDTNMKIGRPGVPQWHTPPSNMQVIPDSALDQLATGAQVYFSYYHTLFRRTTGGGVDLGPTPCMSAPLLLARYEDYIARIRDNYHPDGYHISTDEVTGVGFDAACSHSADEAWFNNTNCQVEAIRRLDPGKLIFMWDDMISPYFNGRKYNFGSDHTWTAANRVSDELVILNWYHTEVWYAVPSADLSYRRNIQFFADAGLKQQTANFGGIGANAQGLLNAQSYMMVSGSSAGCFYSVWGGNAEDHKCPLVTGWAATVDTLPARQSTSSNNTYSTVLLCN